MKRKLKIVVRDKIYLQRPAPIEFMSVPVDTSVRVHDDFNRLLFFGILSVKYPLDNELPEESDQFRFLRATSLTSRKGSVGLILEKESDLRISIPIDLSSRPFIPLPCFIRSRCPLPLLPSSLVLFPPCSV
jgi:hypothetical protein